VPRSGSASLSTATARPRSLVSGATARSSYYGSGRYGSHCGSVWSPYWNPCGYSNWGWSWGWCGSFTFGFSCWNPWPCYSWGWWNRCYTDCWYSSWRYPYCAPVGYWWYPTSTYCPTYLYVPSSSVVVVDDGAADVVVAAGGTAAEPAAAAAGGALPESLAAPYLELGDFYFAANRLEEAADAYSKARGYKPDDAAVNLALSDAVFATGDFHYAAFLISEAIRLDPGIAQEKSDKRTAYGDPKLFEEHMKALESWIEKRPFDAQAHLVHGYNLLFSDRKTAAIAAFRRVLEIMPDHRAAQTFLAALEPAPTVEPAGR
jgi:hypothetical protein